MAATLDFKSWRSRSDRERRTLLAGGAIAVLLFFLAVVLPLDRGVARLHQQVRQKQTDLVWMRSVAPELAAAGPAQSSAEPLIVIVDQSARETGLGGALTGTAPSGSGGLSVQLHQAPFDTLIAWLARLHQQNGVRIVSATIDSAGAQGLVNASLVLEAP